MDLIEFKTIPKHYKSTRKFLNLLSKHAANRKYLKDMVYSTHIYEDGRVIFTPYTIAFPDTHHKNQSDAESIESHVLKYHMPKHLKECNYMYVRCIGMVPGVYIYKIWGNNTHRTWKQVRRNYE